MIADTLIVVVCLAVCPAQPEAANRFKAEFQKADSLFNAELRKAAEDAAKRATEETQREREKVLRSFDFFPILEELKKAGAKRPGK